MWKSAVLAAVVALAAVPAMAHGPDRDQRRDPRNSQQVAAWNQRAEQRADRCADRGALARIERVERAQEDAIARGLRNGTLTRREADKLRRQQAQIDRLQVQARRDGVLTRSELNRIEAAQARFERELRRETRDRQVREVRYG